MTTWSSPYPALAFVAAAGLAGCALQTPYQAPEIATEAAWQSTRPHGGRTEELLDWWSTFDDPALAELIRIAEVDSPTLAKAAARIESARATVAARSASRVPAVSGSVSATRGTQQQSSFLGGLATTADASDTRSAGLDASWEIDLFGKLRAGRDAARALLEARTDDWHDARVSLAAELADGYVRYRACRLLAQAYDDQATSQTQTARSTSAAVAAGLTAPADGYLAEAGAAGAAATAIAQSAECEGLVKSLVELTGAQETALRALIDRPSPELPEPLSFDVESVPADLLRQRPDLASAERALAASYAEIGIARADRLPSLSLGGAVSRVAYGTSSAGTTWSLGPSLSLPIFDGGAKKANVAVARAGYDEALADYVGAVRAAVTEVEQALVSLDAASGRHEDSLRAAAEYRRYYTAIETSWRAGTDSLLTLEQARRSAIDAETALIGLRRDRVRYWIALYRALGGGWQREQTLVASVARAVSSAQGVIP